MSTDLEDRPITNIKTVVLPETLKVAGLPFDPERDIPLERREEMKKVLHSGLEKGGIPLYGQTAIAAQILFPEIIKGVGLLSPKILLAPPTHQIIAYPHEIKLLYPQIPSSEIAAVRNGITFEDCKRMIEGSDSWGLQGMGKSYILTAFILYPERFREISRFDSIYEAYGDLATDRKSKGLWSEFAEFKLLQKLTGRDPEITDIEWKALRENLDKSVNIYSYAEMAMRMRLLSAKEIRMTGEGLKLILPEPESIVNAPAVPVSKKY